MISATTECLEDCKGGIQLAMNEEGCLFLVLWYRATEYMALASLRSCLLPTFFFYCLVMHSFLLYIITT